MNHIARKKRKSDAERNVLSMYLSELDKLAPLEGEEREQTELKAKAGDKAAREKLIKSHLRFVVSIAKKYQGKGLPLSDLINEGNLGLVFAAERFDPSRGYKFITYAVWWIKQAIIKALYDKSRAIRLPANRIVELSRIENACEDFRGEEGVVITENEVKRISTKLNMTEVDVRLLMQISQSPVSLDSPLYGSVEDAPAIVDGLCDDRATEPENYIFNALMLQEIERSLKDLDVREASIIRYHYGIGDTGKMSLGELGATMGITKERARQLEKKALKQLASAPHAKRLRPYCA